MICDDVNKKCHVAFKYFFFWKFLSYIVCVPSFMTISSSSLTQKKYGGCNFTLIPRQQFQVQNKSVRVELIELTESFDTLNCKPCFKHCILQTILHLFILFLFVWSKIFCSKTWSVFYIFLICFCEEYSATVLKAMCFWCFLYKVIGNQGCFSYSRCDLLGKAIKTVFWKTSTNAYPQYFVIHYIAKYQSIRYTIKFIDVLPLCV